MESLPVVNNSLFSAMKRTFWTVLFFFSGLLSLSAQKITVSEAIDLRDDIAYDILGEWSGQFILLRDQALSFGSNIIRMLSLPFDKTICGNQATLVFKWFTETGFFMEGFGTSIDKFVTHLRVFGPGRDQPPFHPCQLQLIWCFCDHRRYLTRGDIKTRKVLKAHSNGLEMRLDSFDGFCKCISSAHFSSSPRLKH